MSTMMRLTFVFKWVDMLTKATLITILEVSKDVFADNYVDRELLGHDPFVKSRERFVYV